MPTKTQATNRAERRRLASIKDSPRRLLTRAELCELLGVSYVAIWTWVRDGRFPAGISITDGIKGKGTVRWDADEVEAWIAARPRRIPKGSKARSAA